jgi:hypothetical protein
MIYAALAVIALFVVVTLLLPKLATVNPSSAALGVRRTLGGTILAMSAFTALRGLLPVAVSLFLLGLAIMNAQGVFRKAGKEKGQRSSVKTSVLEMKPRPRHRRDGRAGPERAIRGQGVVHHGAAGAAGPAEAVRCRQ